MYEYIYNPTNNKKFKTDSKAGIALLKKYMTQLGGAKCSKCGAAGVTMRTCPLNAKAKNTKPELHKGTSIKTQQKKTYCCKTKCDCAMTCPCRKNKRGKQSCPCKKNKCNKKCPCSTSCICKTKKRKQKTCPCKSKKTRVKKVCSKCGKCGKNTRCCVGGVKMIIKL